MRRWPCSVSTPSSTAGWITARVFAVCSLTLYEVVIDGRLPSLLRCCRFECVFCNQLRTRSFALSLSQSMNPPSVAHCLHWLPVRRQICDKIVRCVYEVIIANTDASSDMYLPSKCRCLQASAGILRARRTFTLGNTADWYQIRWRTVFLLSPVTLIRTARYVKHRAARSIRLHGVSFTVQRWW